MKLRSRILRKEISAALALGLLLGGCQPTPEQEAISQKGDINEVVGQYAKDTQAPDGQDGAGSADTGQTDAAQGDGGNAVSLKEQLGVKDTLSFELVVHGQGMKIIADHVPVEFPDASRAGAAAVVRADLDDATIREIFEKFTDGRTLYERSPVTKEDIMAAIERAQEKINELKADGSPEAKAQIAGLEDEIKMRQASMAEVPSANEVEKVPITFEWTTREGSDGSYISWENSDDGILYSGGASKSESGFSLTLGKNPYTKSTIFVTPDYFENAPVLGEDTDAIVSEVFQNNSCQYTSEEAVRVCMDFLEEYGISTDNLLVRSIDPVVRLDTQIMEVGDSAEGYELDLTHGVGEIGQTRTDNHIFYMSEDGSEVFEGKLPYDYESMTVVVGNDGVCSFSWSNPMVMGEVLSEDVALKSFDEIVEIIQNHLAISYENFLFSDGYEMGEDLELGKITFGMMRIQNKDDEENYTLIPVWDVFAMDYYGDAPMSLSMMTINAMDGSIISRENGY